MLGLFGHIKLLGLLCRYRWVRQREDVWARLEMNWEDFWWMTDELPPSLTALCNRLAPALNRHIRNRGWVPARRIMSTRNRLLLVFIWMRRYPTLSYLAVMFGINPSTAVRIIHHVIPILHQHLVPRFIRWPTHAEWKTRRNGALSLGCRLC